MIIEKEVNGVLITTEYDADKAHYDPKIRLVGDFGRFVIHDYHGEQIIAGLNTRSGLRAAEWGSKVEKPSSDFTTKDEPLLGLVYELTGYLVPMEGDL